MKCEHRDRPGTLFTHIVYREQVVEAISGKAGRHLTKREITCRKWLLLFTDRENCHWQAAASLKVYCLCAGHLL